MQNERILITGAAGSVGSTSRETIRILLDQGRSVRAMVHKMDERAESLRAMGAEIAVADMLDIVAVRAAMQGCEVVYFTMSISPSYLEVATNMAAVARSLGVTAFVNVAQMTLSQMSDTETTTSVQQKQHWLAEQVLRWSGLPVVYLRPTVFFDGLFLALAAKGIREESAIKLPFRDGKTSPIAGTDVGAAAAVILANPSAHIGKVYDLTGAASLSLPEIASEFSAGLGRPIRYVNVPPQVWEDTLREAGVSPHLLNHLVTMGDLHRANRYDRLTTTFQQLVGRAPISAEQYARVHADELRPT
jgi:uncharacterized protein YbjT (DUF2867 family)